MDGVVARTLAGLVLFAALGSTALAWPWGLATLIWVSYTTWYGTTYVVEPVEKKRHPKLYWFVSFFWLATGVGLFLYDFKF